MLPSALVLPNVGERCGVERCKQFTAQLRYGDISDLFENLFSHGGLFYIWFHSLGQESSVVDFGLVVAAGAQIFRAVFWDVTKCSLVGILFTIISANLANPTAPLNREAMCFSETSISIC
jgi:hypothetical protein